MRTICGLFFGHFLDLDQDMENKNKLTIGVAFLTVVLIWSTTPLAIKWSGESVGFMTGIASRMLIGALLALVLTLVRFRELPLHTRAIKVYLTAGTAIYGAMSVVYWGAQYIPSGLISVVFGMTPIVTSLLAHFILQENSLSVFKIGGTLTGLGGLAVIFSGQMKLGDDALMGIAAVLVSVTLHSISSVWIKKLDARLPALIVTSGGLLFSLPFFAVSFLVNFDGWPEHVAARTLWSIVYLGVMGSVVGFVSYYYILSHMRASSVALITLMTPVLALFIGHWLNHEQVTQVIISGTTLVIFGLMLHQWGDYLSRWVWRRLRLLLF